MKKLFTILPLVLLITLAVHAQMPAGMAPAPNRPGNIGHIYGKVLDADGKPLADASLMVMQKKFDSSSKKNKGDIGKGYDHEKQRRF